MPKAKVRQRIEGLRGQKVSTVVWIWCPGCDEYHAVPITKPLMNGSPADGPVWSFNGSEERPTLSPSLLVRFNETVCHSSITDGKIQFLSDSTHALAGQTVELPEVDM